MRRRPFSLNQTRDGGAKDYRRDHFAAPAEARPPLAPIQPADVDGVDADLFDSVRFV